MSRKLRAANLAEATVENVQRTVVLRLSHVFHVILHFHFNAIAFIVFATFELLITVLFVQTIHCPFLQCFPVVLNALQHNGQIFLFEAIDEFAATDLVHIDTFHIVGELLKCVEAINVPVGRPCTFVTEFYK